MDWQSIETAPKEGRIWVKRAFNGKVVKEGWAIWAAHPDPEFAEDGPRWMNEDGRYAFPTPTHWRPHD